MAVEIVAFSGHEAGDGDGAGEGVVVATFGVTVAASSIFLFRRALLGKSLLDEGEDAEVVVRVGVCGGVGVRDDGGVRK